jgi:hypothetical protein
MKSKIITKEVTNILSHYLYNRPLSGSPEDEATSVRTSYKTINRPLDMYLRSYFNTHKYLGGSERSAISDNVYNLVRYEYLLAHLIRGKPFDIDKNYTFTQEM